MTKQRRLLVFAYAALACAVADLVVSVKWSEFDTGLRFDAWWYLLPALVAAALVVQPPWGAAVAGLGAGGVLSLAVDGTAIVTAGINWNLGYVFTAVGLVWAAVLLAVRMVRIFPNARAEFIEIKDARRAPAEI